MTHEVPKQGQAGVALGLFLIAIYISLQIAAVQVVEPANLVLIGLSVVYLASLFLASYFYEQRSFLFRGLIWVCEHLSWPRSKKMAFFFFLLGVSLGSMAILQGLDVIPRGGR